MEKNVLSSSLEDYIEAVYMLADKNGETRVIDISRKLGFSKPSVNAAMKTLTAMGLIEHEPYGKITLTEDGRKKGSEVLERHLLLKDFFMSILCLPEKEAESDACRAEHALSEKTLAGLRYINTCLKEPANREILDRIKKNLEIKGGSSNDA
ncbi:MAG: metal-dependent transcriptional regulator [Elusimicrobiales bacterium]|nr:metal-dependent transcriptional regulator [Elusimicrobiales bacterium]